MWFSWIDGLDDRRGCLESWGCCCQNPQISDESNPECFFICPLNELAIVIVIYRIWMNFDEYCFPYVSKQSPGFIKFFCVSSSPATPGRSGWYSWSRDWQRCAEQFWFTTDSFRPLGFKILQKFCKTSRFTPNLGQQTVSQKTWWFLPLKKGDEFDRSSYLGSSCAMSFKMCRAASPQASWWNGPIPREHIAVVLL